MPARIVIVSGATGTGKTSIARILAESSACEYTAHIHTDDFYEYIRKGFAYPWEGETGHQNETVMAAAAACAKSYSARGYEVFVDGVIGPWFLHPWLEIAQAGVDVRYVLLRPSEQATIARAAERQQRAAFPLTPEIVSEVWRSLSDLGRYEAHAVDTTGQSIDESVLLIQGRLQEGAFRME